MFQRFNSCFNSFKTGVSVIQKPVSPLFSSSDQWTVFYMVRTSDVKDLRPEQTRVKQQEINFYPQNHLQINQIFEVRTCMVFLLRNEYLSMRPDFKICCLPSSNRVYKKRAGQKIALMPIPKKIFLVTNIQRCGKWEGFLIKTHLLQERN